MSNISLTQAGNRINAKIAKLAETQAIAMLLSSCDHPEYMDDHNGGHLRSLKNSVLVEYDNQLCPFPKTGNGGACLNPLYLNKEGKVHLSRWSIGPYFTNLEALDRAGITYYTI